MAANIQLLWEQCRIPSPLVLINHGLRWEGDGIGTSPHLPPQDDFIFLPNQNKPSLYDRNSAIFLGQLTQKATSFESNVEKNSVYNAQSPASGRSPPHFVHRWRHGASADLKVPLESATPSFLVKPDGAFSLFGGVFF